MLGQYEAKGISIGKSNVNICMKDKVWQAKPEQIAEFFGSEILANSSTEVNAGGKRKVSPLKLQKVKWTFRSILSVES